MAMTAVPDVAALITAAAGAWASMAKAATKPSPDASEIEAKPLLPSVGLVSQASGQRPSLPEPGAFQRVRNARRAAAESGQCPIRRATGDFLQLGRQARVLLSRGLTARESPVASRPNQTGESSRTNGPAAAQPQAVTEGWQQRDPRNHRPSQNPTNRHPGRLVEPRV